MLERALSRVWLQLRVLGFGLLVDGDVGIGVFPEGEEILIRLACGGLVAHHHLRAAELQVRQRPQHEVPDDPGMVEHLLELSSRLLSLAGLQIRLAAHVRWKEIREGAM